MKKILLTLMPAMITFGPLFMVISASPRSGLYVITGFAGALGLAAGLASMYRILTRQQQEILRLGRLLASNDHEHE